MIVYLICGAVSINAQNNEIAEPVPIVYEGEEGFFITTNAFRAWMEEIRLRELAESKLVNCIEDFTAIQGYAGELREAGLNLGREVERLREGQTTTVGFLVGASTAAIVSIGINIIQAIVP